MGWPNYFQAGKAPRSDVITTGIRNPLYPITRQLPPAYQEEQAFLAQQAPTQVWESYNAAGPSQTQMQDNSISGGGDSQQGANDYSGQANVTSAIDMGTVGSTAAKGALAGAALTGNVMEAALGGLAGGYYSASQQALGLSGKFSKGGYVAGSVLGMFAGTPFAGLITGPLGAYLSDRLGDVANMRDQEGLRDAIEGLYGNGTPQSGQVFSMTSTASDIFGPTATLDQALANFASINADNYTSEQEDAMTGYTSDYAAGDFSDDDYGGD